MLTRKINKSIHLPKAVVLGLYYTGYGVIRELSAHNIPMYAIDEELKWPERVTRLAKRVMVHGEQDLLNILVQLSESEPLKPVLYLTSDTYVEYYLRYRDVLENCFRIHFPESDVADLLLKKGVLRNLPPCMGTIFPLRGSWDPAKITRKFPGR